MPRGGDHAAFDHKPRARSYIAANLPYKGERLVLIDGDLVKRHRQRSRAGGTIFTKIGQAQLALIAISELNGSRRWSDPAIHRFAFNEISARRQARAFDPAVEPCFTREPPLRPSHLRHVL